MLFTVFQIFIFLANSALDQAVNLEEKVLKEKSFGKELTVPYLTNSKPLKLHERLAKPHIDTIDTTSSTFPLGHNPRGHDNAPRGINGKPPGPKAGPPPKKLRTK